MDEQYGRIYGRYKHLENKYKTQKQEFHDLSRKHAMLEKAFEELFNKAKKCQEQNSLVIIDY